MEKRFLTSSLFISLLLLYAVFNNAAAQVNVVSTLNRISVINKNWQAGGIFYGEHPEKELLAARTEYTKKFDKGSGIMNILFGGPFHYKDNSGAWQDINLNIQPQSIGKYAYVNKENKFNSWFAQDAHDGIKMEYKNAAIKFGINTTVSSFNWTAPPPGKPGIFANENALTYKNVYNNADAAYTLTSNAVLHKMVFNNKSFFEGLSQGQPVYIEETIELPADAMLADEGGRLTGDRKVKGSLFVIINADTIYTIHAAHSWDDSFKGNILEYGSSDELPNGVIKIETSVVFAGNNKFKLVASIPADWLLAAGRMYPVVFDPTVGVGNQASFSSSYRYPFNTCRQQRVSQILFLKNDINAGGINTTGTITQIDFLQNTNNPIANNNIRIKMQEVSWNAMTTPTLTSTGFTNCYGPSTQNYTSGGTNAWRSLVLTTSFTYSNTNNLLLEVSFNNSPNNTSGCTCTNTGPGGYWGWFDAPYAGHRWAYSNSTAAPPSGADCEYSNSPERNPAYGYFIPATRITINTAGGCTPINIVGHPSSQTVAAPAQAQFSISVTGTTPTYQWKRSTDGGLTWSNVPVAAPYSGGTTNQLTINPTNATMNGYRFRCEVTNTCTNPSPVTSNTAVLTINAAGCTTLLTPAASPSIPAAGGTGSFAINVTPNTCSWSASETLTWVTITSPLSGTGDATLNYTVAANTGTARSGIISVNGQNHTVNQLGAAAPTTYTISGRVIENGSQPLAAVVISTTPAAGTATTDAQGYYAITVPLAYVGTVRPSLAPFNFTPLQLSVNSTSYSNKNFNAVGVNISISSNVIPPWQRQGDDYDGSVTVQIGNTTTNFWHLEANVYDANNGIVGTVIFSSTSNTTYNFSTQTILGFPIANQLLKNLSTSGRTIKYKVVFDANTSIQITANETTKIIDPKWDDINYVYYNDPTSTDFIKIPIKWLRNHTPTKVKIDRKGFVAATLDPISLNPESIKRYQGGVITNGGNFDISTNGYCNIDISNSNINNIHLLPGDFRYSVYYRNNNNGSELILDFGVFDLIKIGRISERTPNQNLPSKNILVLVGGILNENESSANDLIANSNDVTSNPNSVHSFSALEYLRTHCDNKKFATWYIAQGNANAVNRNAYDIGIALERIYYLNNANLPIGEHTQEIDLLCHSKGGLDTRAMIAGPNTDFSKSLNNQPFNFNNSVLNSKIKKIVFLGTPHRGASSLLGLVTYLSLGSIFLPGVNDLKSNSYITQKLKSQNLPNGIKFLNLTGYGKIELTAFGLNDGVVNIGDSHKPQPFSINTNLMQLYQNDFRHFCQSSGCYGITPISNIAGIFHMQVHKSACLNWLNAPPNSNYNTYNCTSSVSNLEKIRKFLNNDNLPLESCLAYLYQYIGVTAGSVLPGAKIKISSPNHNEYIGNTDEKGAFNLELLGSLSLSDSLGIYASGYDTLIIPIDNEIINSKKISAAITKSYFATNKVTAASFSLIAQNPITNSRTIQIKVTSGNTSNFLINEHSSDVVFVPLILNNSVANILLDTGYNRIIIKYCGVDTVKQVKEVYYLPDSLMNEYAMNCSLTIPRELQNSKMFVNNAFYKDIVKSDSFKLVRGINEVKFNKFGYRDTVFIIDTATVINLRMLPYSYSSVTDSTVLDFRSLLNPQYWKTVTVKRMSVTANKQISIMQYDDAYTGLSLKPQTRKFVFRKLGSAAPASFKVAVALDQINTPDKDSVYMLYNDGGNWVKYQVNEPGITEYDPEVQKFAFDKLYIQENKTREFALMQKQPPIMKNLDTLWHSGQTIAFPLSIFVRDPDSIKNDIAVTSTDAKVFVNGNLVYITAPINFTGTISYTLTGVHDFINVSKTYVMKVIAPAVYIPTSFTPNGDGLNDLIRPIFLGKLVSCRFAIFNRNGQKVYETTDCAGGWDGKIRGAKQDAGAYVYRLQYQFEGEADKEMTGSFVLIK